LRTNGDLFAVVRLFESCCQLPNNFVMKVEKVSMAARVEARVPFFDTRISAIVYTCRPQCQSMRVPINECCAMSHRDTSCCLNQY
jgi:hypothetical protein